MIQKLKVVTAVGTRPEIIRLSRVIARLDESPAIEHVLVHTGQNYDYELNQVFFEDLSIRKPDFFLEAAGVGPIETIGQILIKIDQLFDQVKPDALLVLGDTNSCLCAIPAKRRHIPIFHMEAGNRCFDQRVPEETNRKIVDHISDINLPYSDIAREYLLREGLSPDRIIKTGSPMFEVLHFYKSAIERSNILEKLSLKNKEFILVSCHREENVSTLGKFQKFIHTLNSLCDYFGYPVIVSTHPRTRKMLENSDEQPHHLINFLKPLGFHDYNKLQISSFVVLSDSGTISEESSILEFEALNIREAHERPEAMEEGSVMMVGFNTERIIQAITHMQRENTIKLRSVEDYSMPNVSEKIVRLIISYTDYINRTVWKKQ